MSDKYANPIVLQWSIAETMMASILQIHDIYADLDSYLQGAILTVDREQRRVYRGWLADCAVSIDHSCFFDLNAESSAVRNILSPRLVFRQRLPQVPRSKVVIERDVESVVGEKTRADNPLSRDESR